MKVKELIELLKREDPKAEVVVRMTNGDYDIYEGPMLPTYCLVINLNRFKLVIK